MVHTKQRGLSKLACNDSRSILINEFQEHTRIAKLKVKNITEMAIKRLDMVRDSILANFSEADLNKTIGQYRAEGNSLNSIVDSFNRTNSTKASQKDDGYVTEASQRGGTAGGRRSGERPPALKRQSRRLSRSLSRSNVKTPSCSSSSSGMMGPPRTGSRWPGRSCSATAPGRQYQTPSNNKMKNFPPITPKMAPNTPMTVLRRPRQGEMVMSLSGSPLLLGSAAGVDEMANCNIPLADGTVLSLVPFKLRKSQVRPAMQYMGPDTYEQLATLKKNLDIVCELAK